MAAAARSSSTAFATPIGSFHLSMWKMRRLRAHELRRACPFAPRRERTRPSGGCRRVRGPRCDLKILSSSVRPAETDMYLPAGASVLALAAAICMDPLMPALEALVYTSASAFVYQRVHDCVPNCLKAQFAATFSGRQRLFSRAFVAKLQCCPGQLKTSCRFEHIALFAWPLPEAASVNDHIDWVAAARGAGRQASQPVCTLNSPWPGTQQSPTPALQTVTPNAAVLPCPTLHT